jgi:small GTP-binding protein
LQVTGNITFNILDIAGQNFQDRGEFYQNADAAIIFFSFDRESTFRNVDKWYNDIKTHVPDIPIVLVGNKCELSAKSISRKDISVLKKTLNIPYSAVSAKSMYNYEKPLEICVRKLMKDEKVNI